MTTLLLLFFLPWRLILLFLGGLALIDHYMLGLWGRWQHRRHRQRERRRLESRLRVQPADRDAAFKLADVLVEQGRHAEAIRWLKPLLQQGDPDVPTLLLMGQACTGAGELSAAEVFLLEARELQPGYGQGVIELALGKLRLAQGNAAAAIEALEHFCRTRPGTVEGFVLLSRAHVLAGGAVAALQARQQAWQNFASAPPFVRRRERFWAWRLRPLRAAAQLVAASAACFLVVFFGPGLFELMPGQMIPRIEEPPVGTRFVLPDAATTPPDIKLARFVFSIPADTPTPLRDVNHALAVTFSTFLPSRAIPLIPATGELKVAFEGDAGGGVTADGLRALRYASILVPEVLFTITREGGAPVTLQRGEFTGDNGELTAFLVRHVRTTPDTDQTDQLELSLRQPQEMTQEAEQRLRQALVDAARAGYFLYGKPDIWFRTERRERVMEARFHPDSRTESILLEVARPAICRGTKAGECVPTSFMSRAAVPMAEVAAGAGDHSGASWYHAGIDGWMKYEALLPSTLFNYFQPRSAPAEVFREQVVGRWPELAGQRDGRVRWNHGGALALTPDGTLLATNAPGVRHSPDGKLEYEAGPGTEDGLLRSDEAVRFATLREVPSGRTFTINNNDTIQFLGFRNDAVVVTMLHREGVLNGLRPSIEMYGVEGRRLKIQLSGSERPVRWGPDRVVAGDDAGNLLLVSLDTGKLERLPAWSSSSDGATLLPAGGDRLVAVYRWNLVKMMLSGHKVGVSVFNGTTWRTLTEDVPNAASDVVGVFGEELWLKGREQRPEITAVSLADGRRYVARPEGIAPRASLSWAVIQSGRALVGTNGEGIWLLHGKEARLVYKPASNEEVKGALSPTGQVALLTTTNGPSTLRLYDLEGREVDWVLPGAIRGRDIFDPVVTWESFTGSE